MVTNPCEHNIHFAHLDETLVIGIPSTFQSPHKMIPNVLQFATLLPQKTLDSIRYVEFMFLDGVQGVDSFEKWKATHPKDSNGDRKDVHSEYEYLKDLYASGVSEQMDQRWEELKLGISVYTKAIAVDAVAYSPFAPATKMIENFHISDYLRTALSIYLGMVYDEENVFVSRQVIPTEEALRNWDEFSDQATAWLVSGERYWKACYDTQEHPAGKLYIPSYVVPVGIKTEWPRRFAWEDYCAFEKTFEKNFAPAIELHRLFNDDEQTHLSPESVLFSPEQLLARYQHMIAITYKIAELEGYRLPGQPEPARPVPAKSPLKRFFRKVLRRSTN